MGITVPGSMALSIRWELSSGLLRQGKLVGGVAPEEDSPNFCFLRAIGGISFTTQRDKNYNTLGISLPRLF